MDEIARRTRSGGRVGRARRTVDDRPALGDASVPKRRIPTYELLDEGQLNRLEAHADWILDNVGVDFRGDDEALDLFSSAGARVDGVNVRFEPGLAKNLCSTAPAQFDMHGRDGRIVPFVMRSNRGLYRAGNLTPLGELNRITAHLVSSEVHDNP